MQGKPAIARAALRNSVQTIQTSSFWRRGLTYAPYEVSAYLEGRARGSRVRNVKLQSTPPAKTFGKR